MTGPLVALGGAAVAVTSVVVVKEVRKETCCPPPSNLLRILASSLRRNLNNIEGEDQWMVLPQPCVVLPRGTSAAKPRNGDPTLVWRHLSPPPSGYPPSSPHTLPTAPEPHNLISPPLVPGDEASIPLPHRARCTTTHLLHVSAGPGHQ